MESLADWSLRELVSPVGPALHCHNAHAPAAISCILMAGSHEPCRAEPRRSEPLATPPGPAPGWSSHEGLQPSRAELLDLLSLLLPVPRNGRRASSLPRNKKALFDVKWQLSFH